jgi:hypothetical protein
MNTTVNYTSNKFYIVGLVFTLFFITANSQELFAQGKGKGKGEVTKKENGPPPWAPAHGYRAKTRYVYFSEYDVYYDHDRGVYISIGGNNWQVTAKIPSILSGVDLKAAVKIDLDFSGDDPQRNNKDHRSKYKKGK